MNYPEIILADEPTGNLDTKTGEEVFYLLKSLSKKFRRTILVTHNPEISKETDRTIHIKRWKTQMLLIKINACINVGQQRVKGFSTSDWLDSTSSISVFPFCCILNLLSIICIYVVLL